MCPCEMRVQGITQEVRLLPVKRVAVYTRVSSTDQHTETQLCDLRPLATARGYEIVGEYTDTISGAKAKRPGLDKLMSDARRGRFDGVLLWSFDRMARSVKHFLEVLDELNHLDIALVSFRENIDTGGPLGRAMIVIVAAISELERSLIVERVRAGMRRAKLEGRQIGRARLDIDREQVVVDRRTGMSLTQVAKRHAISRASVCRLMKEAISNSQPVVLLSDGNLAAHSAVGGNSI
jgi:DNA invertase Pin-like site-specific DNA recombinase